MHKWKRDSKFHALILNLKWAKTEMIYIYRAIEIHRRGEIPMIKIDSNSREDPFVGSKCVSGVEWLTSWSEVHTTRSMGRQHESWRKDVTSIEGEREGGRKRAKRASHRKRTRKTSSRYCIQTREGQREGGGFPF